MRLFPSGASLIRQLSYSLWGLFLALFILLSAAGYVALRVTAERVVPLVLQQWVQLKAQTNQALFMQADASVRRLRQSLVERLDGADAGEADRRFQRLFVRFPDGLWRLRLGLVDTRRAPTLYLHGSAAGPEASARLRAVVSYDLLREQGPALVPPFFSVYMDFVEDGLMVYSRDFDWGGNASASASNASYPTMLGANPDRNPGRAVFWTPVYLDEQAHTWMVSVIAPLDWRGRWVGTIGHDVAIQALIESVRNEGVVDVQQLIFDAQGDLIAHPQLRERIAAARGHLEISALKDPVLDRVRHIALSAKSSDGAEKTPGGREWVAWSRINGPGWVQVDVLSQDTVDRLVLLGWMAVCAIGPLILAPALWLLRRRVKMLVTRPLQRLTRAVDALGQGVYPVPISMGTADELGRLARAFDAMVAELAEQRAHLTMLAEQDALTGLHNRRYFDNALSRFFKEAARTDCEGSVLLFDLDEFKYVNDRLGHVAGDAMLLRVATQVKSLVREADTLCRFGGDEFAV